MHQRFSLFLAAAAVSVAGAMQSSWALDDNDALAFELRGNVVKITATLPDGL
jgi:hypothetical protein